jgi:tetratricopeptide (TPR) repeat protein
MRKSVMKIRVLFAAWAVAFVVMPAVPADPAAGKLAKEAESLLDRWTGERGILIEADKKINAALQLDPKSSPALVQRGRLLMMAGHDGSRLAPDAAKAAEEAFAAAVTADPTSPTPHVLLGHFYVVTRNLGEARKALVRAQALGSTDPWLYNNWASYYKAMDEPEHALAMAEKAIATGKANTKALMSAYGTINWVTAEVLHDRKRADQSYDAMIQLQPGSAWTRGNYARTLIVGFRDYSGSEALAIEALTIMQYPHAMQTLSMALYGQWAAAIDRRAPESEISKLYAKAKELDPDGSMIPECATREPAMKSVMKHLAAKGVTGATRHRC